MMQKIRDQDMTTVLGNLLRIGVLLSATIVLFGGVIFLIKHGSEIPKYYFFKSEPRRFRDITEIWKSAIQGRAGSIIQFGLLILIATPITRIMFSIIGYLLEKDYLYVAITITVLAIILFSW